ncbi:GNAT family N-acetyltransferase [Maribacter sp. TH_r10]|uniref:GNAT family N-acetyltransferase n=1 Tax=Maribacter sp. TH_r10 TaxID=3082086 RepID=UPI0029538218|nr:GNAT family N-acetyltransferase [Maribacter sp. TH_r10]MDV7137337.1 GNAT family N-acetyltransferase [Maribacter sp. TH_r10]
MGYTIRDAVVGDMSEVHALIKELASFEKEANAVEVTVDDLVRDGFGENVLFHCFVAEEDSRIVGLALIYNRYSTWKGPIIHLEDLVVAETMRGTGLGTALLDAVVSYAAKKGAKRINWEVLDWNEPAIAFYEKKGAKVMRDWDVVQLDEKGIQNYLDKI